MRLHLFLQMADKANNTEDKILAAAEEVFQEKGYDGTRMQEVADHAGINKGLLHYYFKSKDKLFEAIFSVALNRMVAKIAAILEMELSLEEKIGMIVDQYMALLLRNPQLPRFVLNELHKNADTFVGKHNSSAAKTAFRHFALSVDREASAGRIAQTDARQLFVNMMSLVIFPFVGRPLLQVVMGTDKDEFTALLAERKTYIKSFIRAALKP